MTTHADHAEDLAERFGRRVRLESLAGLRLRPVRWLWDGRLALGSLALVAGREGLGKSTVAYWLAARITRGELPGESHGTPRAVIVAATEDSWEHTIGPRLVAAGADLNLVYRVDVITSEDATGSLSLPLDNRRLEQAATQVDAALILLDPLISRLADNLDTHKDADVRRALEPLSDLANRTGAVVLGLIHVNKGMNGDALTSVMGSRAFTAVARAVLAVVTDPEDETRRLLGQPKNNLGRSDLPSLLFRIVSAEVPTDEGPAYTGAVSWEGETTTTVDAAMRDGSTDPEVRTATAEAGQWLVDYLFTQGGRVDSRDLRKAAAAAGHSYDALKRARPRVGIGVEYIGFPRRSEWVQDAVGAPVRAQSEQPSGESAPTALTALTGESGAQSVQSVQSEQGPREAAPTGELCTCGWGLGTISCTCPAAKSVRSTGAPAAPLRRSAPGAPEHPGQPDRRPPNTRSGDSHAATTTPAAHAETPTATIPPTAPTSVLLLRDGMP